MNHDHFLRLARKILASMLIVSVFFTNLSVHATVINNAPENILSGINNQSVNLANSGAYTVDFSLSGTLDSGDTLYVSATDGSGATSTGTFFSAIG